MARPTWVTKTVVGIVLATFFSDVGHEMVTAVLPLYLAGIGLGAAALGAMEGAADLAFSLSKLAGGAVGHRAKHKRPWATAGYLATTLGTGAIALVHAFAAVITFRTFAWFGRGFRSPLRDFLLADEVGATHFGRAYGFERSADMIGAVVGPLVAAALVWSGMDFKHVILWSIIPSAISVLAIASMTKDREQLREPPAAPAATSAPSSSLPRNYWLFVGGVLLFGLGDFSRTFLILLAASVLGEHSGASGMLSTAVLLYAGHNFVSALAAYPAGHLGDARSKSRVLVGGYALGVVTNVLLAISGASIAMLVVAIMLSGVYIAIEETLEKAVVAELLPRDKRSLGLGILASANALGDLGSSLFVGAMLAAGHRTIAFAVPACVGALGVMWMWRLSGGALAKPRATRETPPRQALLKPPATRYPPRMGLGPLTEAALRAANVDDDLIGEIKRGEATWRIGLASTAGYGPTLDAARAESDLKRRLKYFEIVVTQTPEARKAMDRAKWRRPHKELLANDVGDRIARAREYEEALAQRGDAKSVIFAAGDPNDWGQVAGASTWNVLANDFHRAAQIVARSHTQEEPAPTLALLQLCRHSIELELKTIIDAGRSLVGDARAIHPTHGLMNCWRDAYPHIERWWSKEVWDQTAADRVRGIVAAFDEIDSTAMTTRYPVDTSGQAFERPATLLNFSIKKMMEEYEYAMDLFFSAHLFIEVQRSIQQMDDVDEEDDEPDLDA